jgi:hypothetical protein
LDQEGETPEEREARRKKCEGIALQITHVGNLHDRAAAEVSRTLDQLGVPHNTGIYQTVQERIQLGAQVGAAATGFGSLNGFGFASAGLGAFASGIDFAFALDAHASGNTYLRNRRLASAGVGVGTATLAVITKNVRFAGWFGIGVSAAATGIQIYETSSLNRLYREEFNELKQHAIQREQFQQDAASRLNSLTNEYNANNCDDFGE